MMGMNQLVRPLLRDGLLHRSRLRERMMLNKWVRLALLGLVMSQGMQARAQYLPTPVGAARMPDPAPITPKEQASLPPLIPGPLTSELAPPAPGPDLSLSEGHNSAFQAVEPESKLDVVFSFGAIGLKRQGIGSNPIAVLDNVAHPLLGFVNLPVDSQVTPAGGSGTNFPVPTDIFFKMLGYPDDGRNPPSGTPFFGNFGDLQPAMTAGAKLGVML